MNFGLERIKDGIVRMLDGLPAEAPRLADSQENIAQRSPRAQSSEKDIFIL
jgi:hypothetical protein